MNVEIKDDKQNPFDLANRMYYVFKRLYDEDNQLVSFTYLFQETCRFYMLGLIEYADKKDRLVDGKVNILSLFDLKAFIVANVPEFQCDWEKVMRVAKYTADYCIQESFYESDDEICMCLNAVETIKKAVNEFVNKTEETTGEIKALEAF